MQPEVIVWAADNYLGKVKRIDVEHKMEGIENQGLARKCPQFSRRLQNEMLQYSKALNYNTSRSRQSKVAASAVNLMFLTSDA